MLTRLSMTALLLLAGSLVDASPIAISSSAPTPAGVSAEATLAARGLVKEVVDNAEEKLVELAARKVSCNRRAVKRSVVNIPLVKADEKYGAYLSIGTPAQLVPAIADTGSADLLVSNAFYSKTKSLTDVSNGTETSFSFLGADYEGEVVTDSVTIGGDGVSKQTFAVVEKASKTPSLLYWGLGPASAAKASLPSSFALRPRIDSSLLQLTGASTFFQNLVQSGKIAANKFSLYLNRDGNGAELTLGGVNPDKYTGLVTKVPVVNPTFSVLKYWALALNTYAVGDEVFQQPTTAIIDSGSDLTYIPKEAAAFIFQNIPGAELDPTPYGPYSFRGQEINADLYHYPCNTTVKPSYVFGNSRRKLTVDPQDYYYEDHSELAGYCYARILGVDINVGGQQMALIGTDFLKSWYTTFDFDADESYMASGKPSISFATAKY
ncbi:hypothetical protein JCM8547_006115 [Rhodosporidiobolus lusitaniae]